MGTSVFGIGISGMNAAQAGLVTTGHNIANATTPGYSRQETVQTTNIAQFTGAGFFGQGVAVTTVKRIYDEVLSGQLALAQSQGSELDAYYAQIKQLDGMLGDASAGLSPSLQDFFAGVADVAAHPDSVSSRQALIAAGNALMARFSGLAEQMNQMQARVNSDITSSVTAINNYATQIASLNRSIVVAESAGAQSANDLRDQRDQLLAELNLEVRAVAVKDSSGNYNIFVGNGQPVVVGGQAYALLATPSLHDPQRIEVGCKSGANVALISRENLQGGRLGGLLAFRSETLDVAQNSLGRIAIGLAQTFNVQHALGQDLNGKLGSEFFEVAQPMVLPSKLNAGSASVSASLSDASALTTSDYLLTFEGSSGANDVYSLRRLSDNVTQSYAIARPGGYPATIDIDGVRIGATAGASANDSWIIEPTRAGAADLRMALSNPAAIAAATPIRTAGAGGNTGDATISAGSVTSVAALPLAGPVTLTYDAANARFDVSGGSVATLAYSAPGGASIQLDGMRFVISGVPADGDVFRIENNLNGVSDNRNALALAALQTRNTLAAPAAGAQATANFQGAYSQLVSQIGNTTRQMQVTAEAQTNLVAQTKQAQQSLAGVNLDEEAANLLRYQQAYQASGKMMQIASTLFQTVLDLGK